ncbi:MAG: DUF4957 domain-containing protein [Flavobacteriales bacterium]|nr:MAG: DUF4957 domain-containing protein [Flavobacteriales bacterium]
MKINFKNILNLGLAFILLASGCKKNELEEVEPTFARTFSASALKVTVLSKVNALFSWDKSSNAKSYTIELFETADFSGTPKRTVAGISGTALQYTVTGLEGDTKYYARLKAIGTETTGDSNWKTIEFSTDPEQLLNAVDPANIKSTSVTITWPAATVATSLVFTPGNITHTLTATEIANGSATVTGLTPETTYTVKLINLAKTKGTISFKSGLNLNGYTEISNDAELAAALLASGPQRLALYGGTYTLTSNIVVDRNITITAADPARKPVLVGAVFKVSNSAALTLSGLVLNGNATTSNMVEYPTANPALTGALVITGSEIYNYTKGLVYIAVACVVESVTINNNIIRDMSCTGASLIDYRNATGGFAKITDINNNTFYNITTADAQRDLIRIDNVTSFPAHTGNVLKIERNTFNNVLSYANSRYLYARLTSLGITVNNNIIANSLAYYSDQSSTTIAQISGNNYFNAASFYDITKRKFDAAGNYTTLDPAFLNVASGNFTVGNELLKASKTGDPRWIK